MIHPSYTELIQAINNNAEAVTEETNEENNQ